MTPLNIVYQNDGSYTEEALSGRLRWLKRFAGPDSDVIYTLQQEWNVIIHEGGKAVNGHSQWRDVPEEWA